VLRQERRTRALAIALALSVDRELLGGTLDLGGSSAIRAQRVEVNPSGTMIAAHAFDDLHGCWCEVPREDRNRLPVTAETNLVEDDDVIARIPMDPT
jgi:hypothetical protein